MPNAPLYVDIPLGGNSNDEIAPQITPAAPAQPDATPVVAPEADWFAASLQRAAQSSEADLQAQADKSLTAKSTGRRLFDSTIGGASLGMWKGLFETKDFVFGETPPSEQSDMRRNLEEAGSELQRESGWNSLSEGVGQVAKAMMLLLFVPVAEAVPKRELLTLFGGDFKHQSTPSS